MTAEEIRKRLEDAGFMEMEGPWLRMRDDPQRKCHLTIWLDHSHGKFDAELEGVSIDDLSTVIDVASHSQKALGPTKEQVEKAMFGSLDGLVATKFIDQMHADSIKRAILIRPYP